MIVIFGANFPDADFTNAGFNEAEISGAILKRLNCPELLL